MDSQTIRAALGKLQADPDSAEDWEALRAAAQDKEGKLSSESLIRLLEAARERHAERGEWEAVAQLLDIEAKATAGTPGEAELLMEQARVASEQLFDEEAASVLYYQLLELRPEHPEATAALDEAEGKRGRYEELCATYLEEAKSAPDDVYASSMLMRAAEMELRFAADALDLESVTERLEQAVRLDPTNERAGRMLERIYRRQSRWEEVARALERVADRSEEVGARVGAGVRLARLYAQKLEDNGRAAGAHARVLRDAPDNTEAMEFLSEFYSNEERWDELVALYEHELNRQGQPTAEQLGDMLQIAMLHWRKREKPEDAEPWFERVRKLHPDHEGMVTFYREYSVKTGDEALLLDVLQGAQRAIKDPEKKKELSREIAQLAEGQENAHKAIEQYKSMLRHNPDDESARDALKRLYRQTQGYNALVELLRQQLERTSADQYEKRLEILREVASVYRQHLKSDTALVSVLNQIVQLDNRLDVQDVVEVRELCALYEKLQRWRDLLTTQQVLAGITEDPEEKKELYRSAARRWLEQFSNVQQATDAYAALIKIAPEDQEAREKLEDLYRRRRAWPALYELFEGELQTSEGARRLQLMQELAQLAAERLNRGADAVRLYKQILDTDPSRGDVLDLLEKYAERAKDWATLGEALEKRVDLLDDPAQRLNVLQKLGSVYADQLKDHHKAASAWRRVLELQPGHPRALRVLRDSYLMGGDYDGLEQLYDAQNDWEGLADVLSNAADRTKESAVRVELSYRAAAVYETRLGQPDRAFRSYERILSTDPSDARAARALIPIYEREEKWIRLPALYEVLYEQTGDDEEKLLLLERLVEVTGKRLNDRKAAAGHARRAYETNPTSETALALMEETARGAGSWESFVEAVEARVATLGEPEARRRGKKRRRDEPEEPSAAPTERRMLELKLAKVYAEELGRIDQAVETYKKLLSREPADGEAVEALEQILRREDRRDDLRWLLALKVEHAAEEERSLILADWAAMEEDVFQAPEKAIDCYRQLLDLDRTHQGALVALPRLLLASGDAEGAVRVIEQHRDQLSDEERAEREVELASLYLTKLNRPEEALEAAIRALDVGTQRSKAVEVLEKLLDNDRVRLRVAEVLASEYASGGDARHEAQALSVILQQTTDDVERLALYTRLADVHEQKLSAHGKALDVVLEALHRYPREIGLWIRAEQLSAQSGRPTDLAEALREALSTKLPPDVEAELSERAARLHEEALGDPIGATPYLEKALELDPGNEVAFTRLKDILTAAERWSDLEALYDRASKAIDDPVRQTEMLVEVALICEEIIEDPKKATLYYERILRADPQHEGAIRALDRLYVKQGRDRDLAELLAKRLEMGLDEDVLELKIRLAKIRLDLLEPDRAIGHVEDVLSRRSNDRDARTLAERMLEIGSLRVRAARILEQVYESRHEIRDLDRMLSIRLEGLDETPEGMSEGERRERDQERLELLRRMAALRDDRLHDDQGALDTLSRLVPADPLDIEARERLLVVGRRVGAHERVAEVLAQASQGADSPAARGEILMRVASIYEDFLGDQAKAEQTYRQVLELDRSDAVLALPAARALERIHLATGQHTKLAEILRVEVRLETDGPARRELLGRLGELCQSVLDDAKGAIEAWRARTDDDPTDELALAALDQLYQRTEQWRELVLIIERRREITDDDQMRKALLMRAAEIYRTRLESVSEAIEAYQALIEQFGPDSESFRALEALFEAAERWDELGETFERHLDIVESDAERLDLLAKVGDLRRERLDDLDGALEAYRRALSVDTAHEPSRLALQKLLESEDPAARREAAFVLHPIYEADGDNDRLLKVIEIEVGASDDPLNRLEGLESAMRVAEGPLNDKRRAYSYARRAVRTALGHTDLEQWLDHLERLAAATGQHADQVQLLSEIVGEIFDGNIQLTVTQRIADLARGQLNDRKLAQEYYQKALELRPDDRRSLRALESLYDEAGDAQSLLGILERRVEAAESDAERKELLFRRARLLSEVVKDKPRAIEVYEAILDLELDPAAIQALEALYREVERWDSLIQLYERQLDAGLGNSPDLHVKIAKVAGQNQGDMLRAFADLEQALEIDRQYAGAVAELERMQESAPEAEQRARAAQLLEPVYLVRSDFDAVMRAIRSRLEFTSDVLERRELRTRLAKMFEEQQEDYASALETIAKLLPDDPSDENTISELERLAKAAGAEKRLAEIYAAELERTPSDDPTTVRLARRTGELFARLVELDRALVFYRRALTVEPDSVPLFEAIDDILKRTERHEDRVQLYRDALEHRFEPAERLRLLHTIASLQRGPLGQPDEAIETYRSLLDVEQSDQRALEALTELYRERKRWDDLAELQLRRAESAERPEEAAEHRLALALLFKTELGDVDRALDQLQEIVNVLPSHPAAIHELEVLREDDQHKQRAVEILRPLYETTDDWKRLLKLNEDRFALAADPSDKVNVLRETARLWEERGRDFSRARRALAEAILIDPDDSGVRSEYERLAELGRAWDQLAETYELVLTEKPDTPSKRDILAVLAKVHDTQRNDPRQALNAYRRLHGVDSAEMEPLEKLEQLSMLLGDWPVLVEVLTTKADLVMSDDERAAAWRQVGEVRRDMLDDSDGAVAAYERAMELDPQDTNILDQVIRLHEDKANADRLVELYQQRVDLIQDGDQDLKYELLVKSADLFEKTLTNSERAIEALRHALEVRPGDSRVLMALNRLYRQEEMWPELLDALRLQATGVEGAEARAELNRQIGDLLSERLDSHEEALDAYQQVLDDRPEDAEACAAVLKIGKERELLRQRVAEILVPVLRRVERHQELVDVLEMRLSGEGDAETRAETLRSIAEVLEGRLNRPLEAQAALLRALAEKPDAAALHADVERLSEASGSWEKYADALSERAQSTFEPEIGKDLYTRLGRIAEEKLKDDQRAVEAYMRAVEQSGDQLELLTALDRLYTRLDKPRELSEVLERRVVLEAEPEQAEIYYRLALIQIRSFEEPSRGLASLRNALERSPNHQAAASELEKLTDQRDLFEEAAELLEVVYRSQNRTDRLAALYEKRVGFAENLGERIEMRRNLARVLEEDGHDPAAAQRVVQLGLLDDPADEGLLAEIERLAALTHNWEGAAAALREAIDKRKDLLPSTAKELCVKLAGWQRDKVEDAAAAERALTQALEFEPEDDEVLQLLEDLQRKTGRSQQLIETLRRRAKLQGNPDEREQLYRQAKELAQERNEKELAEAILRELLAADENNTWALSELTELREAAGDFAETFKLLVRRAELAAEGDLIRDLRRRAAAMARDKLDDKDRAIELFEQLFNDDPTDAASATAVRGLYQATSRWQDLASLLEKLADSAESSVARMALRIELARLNQEQFKAPDTAIELLRSVLDDEPGHTDAVVALSELYEQTQRDAELAELLSSQIAGARERSDTEAELRFQVRLGEVYESRLKDSARAIETYRSVLERDSSHRGALEALARLYSAENQDAEAAKILDQLLGMSEGEAAVRLAVELAERYQKLGDQDNTARALERGLTADQRNADLRARLRRLYESTQSWERLASLIAGDSEFSEEADKKVELLRQAAKINSEKRNDHAAAAELLDRASQIKPDDRQILLDLCDEYSASGRGRAAAEVLEKIVESYGGKRSKELGDIHRRLGDAYLAEGDAQRALEELDKAFRIEPGNIGVLQRLGDVALKVGDLKKAQQMFRALLLQKLDANSPISKAEVFIRLADIHEKLDEKPKAIQMLERAVQSDPDLEEARTRLQQLKGK